MHSNSISLFRLWAVLTGIASACILMAAAADTLLADATLSSCIYGAAAAASVTLRWSAFSSGNRKSAIGAGMVNAAAAGYALATVFSPTTNAVVLDETGLYLMLLLWVLMADNLLREGDLRRNEKGHTT